MTTGGYNLKNPLLSDSRFKIRPSLFTYLESDETAGPNEIEIIKHRRLERARKFPNVSIKKDYESFNKDPNVHTQFNVYSDDGACRAFHPYRDDVVIVDPVSGFVSAGADVDRQTGHYGIKPFIQVSRNPQDLYPPRSSTIIRDSSMAPFELQRSSTDISPLLFNSRKPSHKEIRSQLGGWTSSVDPREQQEFFPGRKPVSEHDSHGKLAHRFRWISSTQRAYEDVNWDGAAPGAKKMPPETTFEIAADQVSQNYQKLRYNPRAADWQSLGSSWDWFQQRRNFSEHRPSDYCAPLPRASCSTGYSGCVGADNTDEIDNRAETFVPYTVRRSGVPTPTPTAASLVIPGTTVIRRTPADLALGYTMVNKSIPSAPASPFRVIQNGSPIIHSIRKAPMSKVVTTVAPYNPFNKIERMSRSVTFA